MEKITSHLLVATAGDLTAQVQCHSMTRTAQHTAHDARSEGEDKFVHLNTMKVFLNMALDGGVYWSVSQTGRFPRGEGFQ
jgi:predicted amidohydrolase YtcJ